MPAIPAVECPDDGLLSGRTGPLIHPAIELAKIRVCNLNDEDFAKVTCDNIMSLLRPV
jgi:hypothetical protein